MSKERRESGDDTPSTIEASTAPQIGPAKRSGTAGAPDLPPPRAPGKRSLTQHFAPRPTRTADVASRAVERKGSGNPLDAAVRTQMESQFGARLGDVRVHDDPHSQAATKLMGARAFAHGTDIFLGPNESPTDLRLMAHELTHVIQQRGDGAPTPQRKVEVGPAGSPAEQQADAVADSVTAGAKPPMLVDSGVPVAEGQMAVAEFLAALRTQVEGAAAAKFGPLWSVTGCHYIEKYFAHYQGRTAKEIERAMKLYAPEAGTRTDARAAIAGVVERVKLGMASWEATGELPADAAAIAPPDAQADAQQATDSKVEKNLAQAMPHTCTAMCKHAPGEHPADEVNPMAALGAGQPLPSNVASRMGDALGTDVSTARIHTGEPAERLATKHNATAMAVGQDIAFGAGEYQPGTLIGDALLAHELAHTVQQKGADPTSKVGGESAAAETNADQLAAGAVAQLHGGMSKEAAAAFAISQVMATGLQLQRCSPENAKKAAAVAPSATGTTKDLLAGTKAPDEVQKGKIDKLLNPGGAGGAASLPYVPKDFKKHMATAIDRWRKALTRANKAMHGANAITLDMTQVRKTGDAAQNVVQAKYGEFIKGSSGGPVASAASNPAYKVSDPKVLHPQEETVDPLPPDKQEGVAFGLVMYAMEQPEGGQQVMVDHHVDTTRPADDTDYMDFVIDYGTKHKAELLQIQRDWPGEQHPLEGTVFIQTHVEKDPALTANEKKGGKFADANLRRSYWGTFQTLIHEYLHAAAHGKWRETAKKSPSGQKHVMVEGACEYFTERTYQGIEPTIAGDVALREQVEGKKYDWTPEVLPAWGGYDSRKVVEQWVAEMGGNEANLRAAYFMGHVELVGLGGWKKDMAGEKDMYDVLVDNYSLSSIAKETFVSEDDLRAANGFGPDVERARKGMIKCPGVSYHYAVEGDTGASVAAQHNVTESALATANSHISDWSKLRDGRKILIPAH